MSERDLIRLEKKIIRKIDNVRVGKETPKDSGVVRLINMMQRFDEPLYTKLLSDYKQALIELRS